MLESVARIIAGWLPRGVQRKLRRQHLVREIRRGRFVSREPEFDLLAEFVNAGDCVLDIGANVGHYTARLSQLVGPTGRVYAFEPVPETFALLAYVLERLGCDNVTLINAAVSDRAGVLPFTIPLRDNGIENLYRAHVVDGAHAHEMDVFALKIDDFVIPQKISFAKVDVEGHEKAALAGMRSLLEKDAPALLLETDSAAVAGELESLGYEVSRLPGSPNVIARPHRAGTAPC